MTRLIKFWFLPRREKQFFCEASLLLLLSGLSVKTIAFRHIDNFLRARWSDVTRGAIDAADDVERLVKLSLSRITSVLPWKTLCLSRSIAEFIMLRRRGIPAVMYMGVKFHQNSSLHAHAWVHTGPDFPEGNSDSSGFTPVVRIGDSSEPSRGLPGL
jgi:Transglutaminase-like superfamily